MKDWQNPIIPNIALSIAGGIELIKLNKASRHPRKESEKTLRRILTYAQDTVYGRSRYDDLAAGLDCLRRHLALYAQSETDADGH